MRVILHWRSGDGDGRIVRQTHDSLSVEVEGEDTPFVFDAVDDGWVEHDWGGHAPIRITDASTGRDVQGAP